MPFEFPQHHHAPTESPAPPPPMMRPREVGKNAQAEKPKGTAEHPPTSTDHRHPASTPTSNPEFLAAHEPSSADVFLRAAHGDRDVLHGSYDEMIGGSMHPLELLDTEHREELITRAWDDPQIEPFSLNAILGDVTLSNDAKLIESVSHIALRKFQSQSTYYDQARALDLMISLDAAAGVNYAIAQEVGEVGPLHATITSVAHHADNYMLALRANDYLTNAESLRDTAAAAREPSSVFMLARSVAGYYDEGDRLRLFALQTDEIIPEDALSEEFADRSALPSAERLHLRSTDHPEALLYDYEYMMRESTRTAIEKDLGIAVSDMEIDEQVWLIQFLKDTKKSDLTHYKEFFEVYGSEGARTFLSLEHGGQEMGERILAIGERYREGGLAEQIFAKYGDLIDAVDVAAKRVSEQFSETTQEQIDHVRDHLLSRGKALLTLASQDNIDPQTILTKLDTLHGEIEIMKALYTRGRGEGTISSIEDLIHLTPHTISGEHLLSNDDLLIAVRDILSLEHGENSEKSDMLMQELTNSLRRDESEVTYLTHSNQGLQAFIYTYREQSGSIHVGGLNVREEVRDIGVGTHLAGATVERLATQGEEIMIEATPRNARAYMIKYGFIIVGSEEFAGTTYYKLHRPTETDHQATTLSVREIKDLVTTPRDDLTCVTRESDAWLPDDPSTSIVQTYRDKRTDMTYYVLRHPEA